jgi:mRNA-degrading endonuclease toxin of MazEF toxin-antitoxin module
VSADQWNLVEEYPRVTLCPLTGAEHVPRRYDTDVALKRKEAGLPKDSVVRCVEVYTVFRDDLIERLGRLSARRMNEVDRALSLYLALPTDDAS